MTYFADKEKWKSIESKGFFRFILFYGVLIVGGVSLLLSLGGAFVFRWHWDFTDELIWSLIAGVLLGLMFWLTGKARFR